MTFTSTARSVLAWAGRPIRFPTLALLLVLGAIFVIVVRLDTVQGDTWWALRAGKDMWHTHRVIRTDTYSYTADGRPWPDHAWLYQVLLYGLFVVGGLPLVSVANAVAATLAIALARPRGRVTWADVLAITPVIALASVNWAVRPQVLSLLLLALVIRLVHAERWRTIVLVMLLWANLHGEVVLGALVLVAALAASLLAWLLGRRDGDAQQRRRVRDRAVAYGLTTAASLLVTLANPMGWGLWRYIATASRRPGQAWIAEWQPSWTAPALTGWFWLWCAVLVLVMLFRWRRLLQWPILLATCISLALAPFAWAAIRNISMFGIATLPLLILLLRRQGAPRPDTPGSVLPGGRVLVALAAVGLVVATTRTLQSPDGLGWKPMSTAVARAIDACPGHVYTTYNGGAYLIWFTPRQKVFVDNRQDPYDAATLQFAVGDPGWGQVFEKHDIRCAALNLTADPQQVVELGAMAHWPVTYADGQWVVLVKPARAAPTAIR